MAGDVGLLERADQLIALEGHWAGVRSTGQGRFVMIGGEAGAGLRDADIAQRLYLSEKTVGHHVSAILRKLDVRTRGQAVAEAVQRGLIGEPPA